MIETVNIDRLQFEGYTMSVQKSAGLSVIFLLSMMSPLMSVNSDLGQSLFQNEQSFTSENNSTNMNGFQVGSIYSRQTIAFPDGDSGVCEIIDGEIWCWMQAWDYNAIEVEVIPDGRKAISLNGQGGGPYCVILDDGSMSCFSDFDVYDLNFSKTVVQLPDGQKALTVGIGGVSDEECADDSWACDEHNGKIACAVTDAISDNIYCFPLWDSEGVIGNSNTYGELGLGHQEMTGADPNDNQATPKSIQNYSFQALDINGGKATAISIGLRHACAIVESNVVEYASFTAEVYCWGNNAYGQLGNGIKSDDNRSIPYILDPWKQHYDEDNGWHTPEIENALNKSFIRNFSNSSPIRVSVLGENELMTPDKFTLDIPVAIDVTGASSCVLLLGGDITCWGGTFWDFNISKANEFEQEKWFGMEDGTRNADVPYSLSSNAYVVTLSNGWSQEEGATQPIALYNSNTQVCQQFQSGSTYCWQKEASPSIYYQRLQNEVSFDRQDPVFPTWGPEFGVFIESLPTTYGSSAKENNWSSKFVRISLQEGLDSKNNKERMICSLMEIGSSLCYDTAQDSCEGCDELNTVYYTGPYWNMFGSESRIGMEMGIDWNNPPLYTCANGEEIDLEYVNDGYDDCSDGSDEPGNGHEFTCDNGDTYPLSFVKDGMWHCDNGEDEGALIGIREVNERDSDGDGFPRMMDLCPNEFGTTYGCKDDIDDDNIPDFFDADKDGDGFLDDVNDMNSVDPCLGQDYDSDGKTNQLGLMFDGSACEPPTYLADDDDDNDGKLDVDDDCQVGELGWISDSSTDYDNDGCKDATEDNDDDNDGILDDVDLCSKGKLNWKSSDGEDHDADGCHDYGSWKGPQSWTYAGEGDIEDIDPDNDGIINDESDLCEWGDTGWISSIITDNDGDGCQDSTEDLDDDNDGVLDDEDICKLDYSNIQWQGSVPQTIYSDRKGCPDTDKDTVPDVDDYFPNNANLAGAPAILTEKISSGKWHSCVITGGGDSVMCWGNNYYGALGNTRSCEVNFPYADSDGEYKACSPRETNDLGGKAVMVTTGSEFSCAIISDQIDPYQQTNGSIKCWGTNYQGELGKGDRCNILNGPRCYWYKGSEGRQMPSTVSGISNAVNIEAGEQHACAILADNSIRCWGLNDNGQVGDGEEIEESYYDQDAYEWHYDRRLKPVKVDGPNDGLYESRENEIWRYHLLDLAAGDEHTCVLTEPDYKKIDNGYLFGSSGGFYDEENIYLEEDSSNVWCWGGNSRKQLGDGSTTNRNKAVQTVKIGGGAMFATSIDAYGDRTCVTTNIGTIWCWGDGDDPKEVTDSAINGFVAKTVTIGDAHGCIISIEDSVQCWGSNRYSQLGDLSSINNPNQISAGHQHTCVTEASGEIKCWGRNNRAQTGTLNAYTLSRDSYDTYDTSTKISIPKEVKLGVDAEVSEEVAVLSPEVAEKGLLPSISAFSTAIMICAAATMLNHKKRKISRNTPSPNYSDMI